jgi:hypothetical protein
VSYLVSQSNLVIQPVSYYFTYFTWLRLVWHRNPELHWSSGDHVVNHSTSINSAELSSTWGDCLGGASVSCPRQAWRFGRDLDMVPKKTRVEDGSIMYYLLYQYTNILQTSSDFEVTKGWSYGSYIDLISMKYVEVALFVSTLLQDGGCAGAGWGRCG